MSVLRRLSLPFANWQRRPSQTEDDLPAQMKDDIFRLHIGSSDFERIDQHTLLTADVVTNKSYAEKVLRACHKTGIIDSVTGRPVTEKIDRNIVKEMPVISVVKQRMLVMLLFYWEEEVTRWRLLSDEEKEIEDRVREGASQGLSETYRAELEYALRMVRSRKSVLPSQRDHSGQLLQSLAEGENERLPTYDEARAEARTQR